MADYLVIGHLDATSIEHTWTIKNFEESYKKAEKLISPTFVFFHHGITYKCRLQLRACNSTKDCMCLCLLNCGNCSITATLILNVLDSNGKLKYESHSKNEEIRKNRKSTLLHISYDISDFEWSSLLNNGALTIECKLYPARRGYMAYLHFKQLQCLSDDLEEIMKHDEFSDFSIDVNGKTLTAHKSLLGKRSHVFKSMITSTDSKTKNKRNRNKLNVTDISHEVMTEMLRYMYCGKVNDIESIAGELLVAAEKYSVNGLEDLCENSLIDTLGADNALERIQLATESLLGSLKTKAMEFIVSNAEEIVKQKKFMELPQEIVCEICQAMAAKN